jgi:hypothetical protein
MDPQSVVARRRRERDDLIERARRFAHGLEPALGVRGVAVFGSVARGDWNVWSDIDVLVVAEHLPPGRRARSERFDSAEPRIQVVAWTPAEWRLRESRGDPIAREARAAGVWLRGTADAARGG